MIAEPNRDEPLVSVEYPEARRRTARWERGMGEAQASSPRGARESFAVGRGNPQISKESIVSSYTALGDRVPVLGPTEYGGYYLLRLKEARPALSQNLPWSTGRIPEKTLNILKIQSLSYISLDAFSDVGTLEDYDRARHPEPLKHLGIG